MSYEGYEQKLCSEGHLCVHDCYDTVSVCPRCGKEFVWHHSVDITNGEMPGIAAAMPYPLVPKTYETVRIPLTYHIPINSSK